jgi:hypothetical protein
LRRLVKEICGRVNSTGAQDAHGKTSAILQGKAADTKPDPKKHAGLLYVLDITADSDTARILGLMPGDSCNVYEAKAEDFKPGDAVAVEVVEFALAGRFVSAGGGRITLRNDEGEESYSRDEILTIGRVDNLNPWKRDTLTPEQRARVKKLQSELAALDKEDDQIIRCTRRYAIEREIFDITHPTADPDDWSAWEEEDEEEE